MVFFVPPVEGSPGVPFRVIFEASPRDGTALFSRVGGFVRSWGWDVLDVVDESPSFSFLMDIGFGIVSDGFTSGFVAEAVPDLDAPRDFIRDNRWVRVWDPEGLGGGSALLAGRPFANLEENIMYFMVVVTY